MNKPARKPIKLDFKPMTLEEVGADLGISKKRQKELLELLESVKARGRKKPAARASKTPSRNGHKKSS